MSDNSKLTSIPSAFFIPRISYTESMHNCNELFIGSNQYTEINLKVGWLIVKYTGDDRTDKYCRCFFGSNLGDNLDSSTCAVWLLQY